jgi:hypothetical protein
VKKRGRTLASRQIDECARALPLGSALAARSPRRRVERLWLGQRVAPHFCGAGASKIQDLVKQRAALQAESARSGAQRAQEDEAAQPLVRTAENRRPLSKGDSLSSSSLGAPGDDRRSVADEVSSSLSERPVKASGRTQLVPSSSATSSPSSASSTNSPVLSFHRRRCRWNRRYASSKRSTKIASKRISTGVPSASR